jgi:hypothetical protein
MIEFILNWVNTYYVNVAIFILVGGIFVTCSVVYKSEEDFVMGIMYTALGVIISLTYAVLWPLFTPFIIITLILFTVVKMVKKVLWWIR